MDFEELFHLFLRFPSICTDTRKIKKNSFFFALKGENFNGNQFAKEAIEKGAVLAIIDDPDYIVESEKCLLVDDMRPT